MEIENLKQEIINCSRYGELEQLQMLLNAQPSNDKRALLTNFNNNGYSALFMASANGHLNILEWILPQLSPKEVNIVNEQGSSSLHWASLNGHLSCVRLLLENGADATLKNIQGRSAVTLAEQQEHLEVVSELLKSFDPEDAIEDNEEDNEEDVVYSMDSNGNMTEAKVTIDR